MIAAGHAVDFREAFERYLGNGKAAFVAKDHLPLAEAIAVIHRAGGLAVLAHPGQLGTRERIAALVAVGLDGVEVLHPSHSWDDAQRLDALAAEFDLVRSGGSDWHGGLDGARSLGMMRVPSQWLLDQERRAATLGSRRVA
jgi:predicted metal-dependent phosphoesterase TrpH